MAKYSKADHVDWESGLFDCFEDAKTCCYGFWCCPCLACTVSERFQENHCLPLFDILCPAVFTLCGIPCFVPPAVFGLRVALRHRYKIKGSLCKDTFTSCFCVWCSWCQMHRELRARDKTPTTVNVSNVVNMQPAPMMMMNPAPVINQTVTVR